MTWPSHFPRGCPPPDASDATGWVFRFVSPNVPIEQGFASWKELYPHKTDVDECLACGLSVSRELAHCLQSRRRVHSLRRKVLLCTCFEDEVGRIKHTQLPNIENHHTWWRPQEFIRPWECFEVIELDENYEHSST